MNDKDTIGKIPNLDIAKIIRSQALTAANTTPGRMTTVRRVGDLPLAAVLEGGRWSGKVFREGFDPRRSASHNFIGYAKTDIAGLDMVRMEYAVNGKRILVLEGKTFFFVFLPKGFPKSLISKILRLEKPFSFQGPDAQGWFSSSPELTAQKMKDWRERIDAVDLGGRLGILVFKIEVSTRKFSPSPGWF